MNKLSGLGSLLKKIYRIYSTELLAHLQEIGYTDLRPSFLEVLLYICEHNSPTIKSIGIGCGLKKQTMTSHLNELEKRGYIQKRINPLDKREQNIDLTEYGERFKFSLFESIEVIEKKYTEKVGKVEIDRIELILSNFHEKISLQKAPVQDVMQSEIQGSLL